MPNLITGDNVAPIDQDVAVALKKAIKKTFSIMAKVSVDPDPTIEKKKIIQWLGRYNILKPHGFLYTAVIPFRHGSKKSVFHLNGIMIVFFTEDVGDIIVKILQLGEKAEEDDVLDASGELLNVIAGAFKTELVNNGYSELEMGIPISFAGDVDELFEYHGVDQMELSYMKETDDRKEPFIKVIFAFEPEALANPKKAS